ncbi:MAG: MFS transporter, partial [Sphingomonadales bacterium]|nr:MFS transporter [Sphingomonadales bacterium]
MSYAAESHRPLSRASIMIAAFSTIVEWYDFTLYLYFATVLSRVFFGGGAQSLALTLAGFAIAYLMRPVGAVFFGHIGDRHGRRRTMLLSVAVMTAAMLAMALLPTRAQAGPVAGALLLLLRCVMGFAVGGEYTGVVAYLFEGAQPRHRGLVASFAAATSEVGGLLAVGIAALTVGAMSSASLEAWGWRIPFFVGAALAGSVWIARSWMEESPEFQRQLRNGTVPANPLRHTLTHDRAGIGRSFAISALGSITYYVGITYVPAFLTSVSATDESVSLRLSTIAALAVILVTPLTGLMSDRWGRRPALLSFCALSAVLPMTMFSWMGSGGSVAPLAGAIILACV